jgi:hypothetical protein
MKQIVLRAYQLGPIWHPHCLRSEGFHPVSIQEDLEGSALRANLTMLCEETKAEVR